jgi:hypothetical protein
MDEGYGVPPPTAQEVLPKTGRSSLKYKRRGFKGVRDRGVRDKGVREKGTGLMERVENLSAGEKREEQR